MSESIDTLEKALGHKVGFGTLRADGQTFKEYHDLMDTDSKIPNLEGAAGKNAKGIVLDGPSALVSLHHLEATSLTDFLDENNLDTNGTVKEVLSGKNADYQNTDLGGWSPILPRGSDGGMDIRNLNDDNLKVALPISRPEKPTMNKTGLTQPQAKRLDQKIKEYQKAIPNPKNKRRDEGGAKVASTPLVHYYASRYIAAMLSVQANEAFNLKQEEIQRISELSQDIETLISDAINLAPEDETGIDRIYDILPLQTTIRFNKPNEADKTKPAVVDRETTGGAGTTEIGILQNIYSMLPSSGKTKFKKGVANLIKTLPREKQYGKYKCVDSEILEDVFVYIEEMILGGAESGGDFKIFSNINKTTEQYTTDRVAVNDTINIPNWMLLAYTVDNGREIMQDFLSIDVNFDWDDREANLLLLKQKYEDENDNEALDELISEMRDIEYYIETAAYTTVKIINITDDKIIVVSDVDNEYFNDQRFVLDKAKITESEIEKRLDKNFRRKYDNVATKNMGLKQWEVVWRHIYNPLEGETKDDPSMGAGRYTQGEYALFEPVLDNVYDELAVSRIFMLDQVISSDELGEEDYGLSRAFQAIGNILLYIIKKNSIPIGERERTKSPFDIAVASLIGTYDTPGPATYHAMLHHEQLVTIFEAAVRSSERNEGITALGQSLVFEQYSKNPAKLMCVWSLAELGLISISAVDDSGVPTFFQAPTTEFDVKLKETTLMNNLALIILSYYRLAFYPIRMRSRGTNAKDANLPAFWKDLLTDAEGDPPEPYAFAAVLRFLAKSKAKLKISVPTWMPSLPSDFAAIDRKRNKEEISDFLSWAYGSNPLSTEAFTEVAAAYHTAKALSYYKPGRYAEMVDAFISAVEEERGEGFLMAVLIAYGKQSGSMSLEPAVYTGEVSPITQVGGFI